MHEGVRFRKSESKTVSPSSTLINITPFGETANLLMFFRFSNGKVHDLSLHVREKNTVKVCVCVWKRLLLEVKVREPIPDGTNDAVTVFREDQVALAIHGAVQVGELGGGMVSSQLKSKYIPCKQTWTWRNGRFF